jgi:quercetin dioxygenase-like cupin family protein
MATTLATLAQNVPMHAEKPEVFAGTLAYEAFEAAVHAEGFDEVPVREWKPGQVLETHTQPFAVNTLGGEFWLTMGDSVRHVKAGDWFELARGVPHAERYGDEGATFWAARRHGAVA